MKMTMINDFSFDNFVIIIINERNDDQKCFLKKISFKLFSNYIKNTFFLLRFESFMSTDDITDMTRLVDEISNRSHAKDVSESMKTTEICSLLLLFYRSIDRSILIKIVETERTNIRNIFDWINDYRSSCRTRSNENEISEKEKE